MKIGNVALLGIFLLSVGSGCASAGSRKPAQANASDPTSVSPPVTPTILGGNIQSFDFKDGNQAIAFRVYAPNKAGEPYTMTLEGYGKKIVAVSSQDYPTDDVFGGWDSKKLAQKMPIILPPHGFSAYELRHIYTASDDLKSFSAGDMDEGSAILSMLSVLGDL